MNQRKHQFANLTNAQATIDPVSQPTAALTLNTGGAMKINKEQAREQTEAELSDTAENNTITQEGLVGNRQDETQTIYICYHPLDTISFTVLKYYQNRD